MYVREYSKAKVKVMHIWYCVLHTRTYYIYKNSFTFIYILYIYIYIQ